MWCRPTKWSVRGFTSWKDDEGCGCGNGCESAIYHLILSILKTEIGQTCLRPHTNRVFSPTVGHWPETKRWIGQTLCGNHQLSHGGPNDNGRLPTKNNFAPWISQQGRFYLIPMVPISPWFDCGILLPLGYQNTIDKKHLYDFTKSLRTHVYIIFHGTCPRCLMDALCLVDSLACLRWKSLDLQLCWHQCQVTLDATRVWSHFLHAGWSCPLDLTSD